MTKFATEGTGWLKVQITTGQDAVPLGNVNIKLLPSGGTEPIYEGVTDETGVLEGMPLACPPRALSLEPDPSQLPYGVYDLTAALEGYSTLRMYNFEVLDGEVTFAQQNMEPINETTTGSPVQPQEDIVDTPPHGLYGQGGSGPAPETPQIAEPVMAYESASPTAAVALLAYQEVAIPDTITVHLGSPSSNAKNVTVTFRDYIKNVASSEIYPTWPEEALRANMHAEISLALNRVYTEWYRSKGYPFDITNSTSYDQYYVHGRTIFDPMNRICDDIFNTYVRKLGTVNPYYTEYCDGKSVTCKGMKQWGTVTQAQSGKNALEILKYYYGNDIEIIRTNNIRNTPESYPGTPLREGSSGVEVKVIQRQLNRVAKDYPSFGTTNVDGVFGPATTSQVKKFQKQFNLTADGIVGRNTWYKISYIYVAVKKLAELGSEGEKPTGDFVEGEYSNSALYVGSRGNSVFQIQFFLNEVASATPEIPGLAVDGIFGSGTQTSVKAFQTKYELSVDGVIGRNTWDAIYLQYSSLILDEIPYISAPGQYAGEVLKLGSRGNTVKRLQFALNMISRYNSSIPSIAMDGIFGAGTERCVRAAQSYYGLPVDGIVGKVTWDKGFEVYTDLVGNIIANTAIPGTYPGAPLMLGSQGLPVKEMQYYLYLLSAYYGALPTIAYDGVFGKATQEAVKIWQKLIGLPVDGIVGQQTWTSLYTQITVLHIIDGSISGLFVKPYPGSPLLLGMDGTAVQFVQFMLTYIKPFYSGLLPNTPLTGVYDVATENAVKNFQTEFKKPVTGVVDAATWDALLTIYFSCASKSYGPSQIPEGEYGGYVLVQGSTGLQVYRLQTYLNNIGARYDTIDYATPDGILGPETMKVVNQFQKEFGIEVLPYVDRLTWDAIYSNYQNGASSPQFQAVLKRKRKLSLF